MGSGSVPEGQSRLALRLAARSPERCQKAEPSMGVRVRAVQPYGFGEILPRTVQMRQNAIRGIDPAALGVYALPFFAGLTAGLAAFHSGSGVIGALVVGVLAGGATLAIGQIAFATVRTPLIRAAIALLFAVPAAIAGYHATFGLAQIGVPAEFWREALAIVGAVLVGGTAWARMSLFVPPHVDRRGAGGPASFPLAGATRDG